MPAAAVDPSLCTPGADGVTMAFTWDYPLVGLSVGVAVLGSFAALECAGRMRTDEERARRRRLSILGAGLMGLAIWTMHFVGMLALQMPMPVSYAPSWSVLSIIAAAVGAGLAFTIMQQQRVTPFHVVLGGVAMGLAIASMHYIGMKSMRMAASIDYEPVRFALSIVIAIGASAGALALGYGLPQTARRAFVMRAGSAVVMGCAIAGMHYMGMAAARYRATGVGEAVASDPMVGAFALRDVVGIAGVVFGGALLALTARAAADRQRALEAYQQLAAELEDRVRARTAELEATNRELSAFSYTVSHDLRNPLRAIAGFVEVLNVSHQAEFRGETREYLDRIHRAALRMDDLLTGLLNLANISRATLVKTEVDLSALARAVVADFVAQEPARRVELVIADGLTAAGDPTSLTSALQNLLHNAWKFTRDVATPRIEFGSERRDGRTVYFVRDNGAGFDLAHATKLFGMFERLHPASDFPGHGVGLAVTKRIIERHGGTIWADSAPGAGAVFCFTIA